MTGNAKFPIPFKIAKSPKQNPLRNRTTENAFVSGLTGQAAQLTVVKTEIVRDLCDEHRSIG